MSDEIELIDGAPAFAYAEGVKPWHGKGTGHLPPGTHVKEAGAIAKLNGWNIQKVDAELRLPPGGLAWNRIVVPNQFHLVRMMDGKVLSDKTVSKTYHTLQNEEIFDVLDPLIDKGILQFETCGSLRDGKMVFALLRFQDCKGFQVSGWHELDCLLPFLYVYTWHDGSGKLHFALVTVQVVCMNTHQVAIDREPCSIGISHTTHAQDRMDNAIEALLDLRDLWSRYSHRIRLFENFKFKTYEEAETLARRILCIKTGCLKEELHPRSQKRLDLVMKGYSFGKFGYPRTAWRLFSAFTYYTTHMQTLRGTNYFESVLIGSGHEINERAMLILSNYILAEKQTQE